MFKAFFGLFFFIALLAFPGKILAQAGPQFIFPVACTLGKDCWTVHYVDVDPAENVARDFTCGVRTNDDHKGTDYALRSMAEMREGVDVLAAKEGKVVRIRNGEVDSMKTPAELEVIKAKRKECGNAVLLDHGSGLKTLYCHLKNDSIIVDAGQTVRAGEKIAQVGHSGLAEFPHLHFGVVWEGGVVDPYTGMLNTEGCGKSKQSLWAVGQPMRYEPFALYDAGFQDKVPDFDAIKNGAAGPLFLSTASPALVFWAGIYGAVQGDDISLSVRGPDGKVFVERKIKQDKTRTRQYYYTGRNLSRRDLAPGMYTATARLKREGVEEQVITRVIEVR